MDMEAYFPPSYQASRERFKGSLSPLAEKWPGACLESHPLAEFPDLSIDWIWAEPRVNENLVIISTAEHGIEGYVGSAMQYLFTQEFVPCLDPGDTGLLLVHTINPWGMHMRYRVNPNNVDLNRNFVYDGDYDPAINPDYDLLTTWLNPQRPLGRLILEDMRFLSQVVKGLITPGMARVQAATLLGQHRHPQGVYFGGMQVQEETSVLMALYRQALERYQNIIQVDLHTGYGPRYQMTVLIPPQDTLSSAAAVGKFGYPLVQKIDADEFYAISGDMGEYFYRLGSAEFPERRLLALGFEFGTFGDSLPALIRSLRISILENQLRQFGAANEKIAHAIRKEFGELFFPSEPRWRQKALADGRQAFEGILKAYSLI
jgi:hypothetical protein